MSCKALSALAERKVKEKLHQSEIRMRYEVSLMMLVNYLRERRGFVLWIWMSQVGHALLVSTWRMMHDLQTGEMEVSKL